MRARTRRGFVGRTSLVRPAGLGRVQRAARRTLERSSTEGAKAASPSKPPNNPQSAIRPCGSLRTLEVKLNALSSRTVAIGAAVALVLGAGAAWWATDAPGSPAGKAASDDRPKVLRVLEGLEKGDGDSKEKDKGDSPTAGADFSGNLFEIPKDRYVPIGKLRIPAIGLETGFYNGVYDAILERGPGLWPGTPAPGRAGNAVLSGHRTTFTHPFGDLDLLEPGDVVRAQLRSKHSVVYRVFKTSIIPESQYVDFVLKQPAGERMRTITMFACHPKGYRTQRIIVQARASKAPPPGRPSTKE